MQDKVHSSTDLYELLISVLTYVRFLWEYLMGSMKVKAVEANGVFD